MARPANSDPDGKRDHEVKAHFTEQEYEDLICAKRSLGFSSNSEFLRHLLHRHCYGVMGKSSHGVDIAARAGIGPSLGLE